MANAGVTYRAVQAVSPGKLELTRKPLVDPQPGYVRIRVEACGVCHSDTATVEGAFPIAWPRVPGHEAVGVIDMLGPGVEGWAVGRRLGVGFLGGSCGRCEQCRSGDPVNCRNQEFTGILPAPLNSCDSDGDRASELQHPVQDIDGDADLGRPTPVHP